MSLHPGPFKVCYPDGKAETIPHDEGVWEGDLRALWRDRIRNGATLLVDADGVVCDYHYDGKLPDVGARVRHRTHPDLTGVVQGYEYTKPGVLSMVPLRVYWDQDEAYDRLGWFAIYKSPDQLEVIDEEAKAS